MMFDAIGRRDDEGTGWLSVDVVAGIGRAGMLARFRRGARVGRVGREELGIGKTVGETAFKEGRGGAGGKEGRATKVAPVDDAAWAGRAPNLEEVGNRAAGLEDIA